MLHTIVFISFYKDISEILIPLYQKDKMILGRSLQNVIFEIISTLPTAKITTLYQL